MTRAQSSSNDVQQPTAANALAGDDYSVVRQALRSIGGRQKPKALAEVWVWV
jgi:hypothetical protein